MVIEDSDHARGFNAGLRESIAILERRVLEHAARSQRALEQLALDGRKTGGDVPYGYKLERDGTTLCENRPEQDTIRIAKQLRLQDLSLREISTELAERKRFARNGRPFSAQQIKRILDGKEQ